MSRILNDLRKQNDELEAFAAQQAALQEEQANNPYEWEDADTEDTRKNSVVQTKYKLRYKERAKTLAVAGKVRKAAKRSAWDWLAETLAGECLDKKAKLNVDAFLAILDANGVDHSRWTNRSPGWEGRLRMTGRLALQREVAETGVLHLPDGETLEAPAEWLAKYNNA